MEDLDVNGNPPALAGCRCDAVVCQQYWHAGQLIEESNVAFLRFDGGWFRLYFDCGVIFWRTEEVGPEPFDTPEVNSSFSYPSHDVGRELGLSGLLLARYEMEPIPRGSRVSFVFENNRRLVFSSVDDNTTYKFIL